MFHRFELIYFRNEHIWKLNNKYFIFKSIQIADSLHLDLRQWLGIPSLPFVVNIYIEKYYIFHSIQFNSVQFYFLDDVPSLWNCFTTSGMFNASCLLTVYRRSIMVCSSGC